MQAPMAPQTMHPQSPVSSSKSKKLTKTQIFLSIALFAVAILATLILLVAVTGGSKGIETAVKKDQYQAVFLNSQDGQVYFGKLENYNDRFFRLTDIFYVRVEQKIQPEGQAAADDAQQSISLAKLGNELHGPEDEMFITKDEVLFWENLKESGQVVTAIREYKKNPDAANKDQQSNTNDQSSTANEAPSTTETTKKP